MKGNFKKHKKVTPKKKKHLGGLSRWQLSQSTSWPLWDTPPKLLFLLSSVTLSPSRIPSSINLLPDSVWKVAAASGVCYIYMGFWLNHRLINLLGVSIHFHSRTDWVVCSTNLII